jgi:hypothetical protein
LSFEALHRLQLTDNSALAFVYCDHTIQGEQTPTNLIGSLLGQLTNRLSEDHPIVDELLQRQSSNKLLDLKSGLEYIRHICTTGSFTAIRLGADGLDELLKQHRSGFLHALAALSSIPDVHFLFFGRNHSGIQIEVDKYFQKNTSTSVVYLELTGDLTVDDRRLFLQERLDKDKDGMMFDEDLRTFIFEKLAPSDSTYVLVHCWFAVNPPVFLHQISACRSTDRRCLGPGDAGKSGSRCRVNQV